MGLPACDPLRALKPDVLADLLEEVIHSMGVVDDEPDRQEELERAYDRKSAAEFQAVLDAEAASRGERRDRRRHHRRASAQWDVSVTVSVTLMAPDVGGT